MKNYPIIAFVAAFVAFFFSSFSFETAGSLIFTTGLASIFLFDYSRDPVQAIRRVAPAEKFRQPMREPSSEFELAA